ncbi:hypothetical protein AQUCO_01300248v1 [Aquilegia coerulea]|uniref:WRC domain-containing protein n=1 Tax=Aquilegia coerulea TaxID=218851 RepID=A0A2G5E0I6_AQUCA|nr:hypothetical protein AQUCO_01300248v1 [Aquilegia coerulea]
MRIRKHAKISPPPPPPSPSPPPPISKQPSSSIVPDPPATHVCELNRSPWDVISFTSQSQQDYGFQIKVDDDDDTCNNIKREPVNATDSFVPLNEQYWAKKVKKEIIEVDNWPSLMVDVDKVKAKKKAKVKKEPDYICCNKTDGKGWFCRNEAKEGEVLCEHHIEQLKNYQFNYTSACRKSTKAKPEVSVKAKPEVTTATAAAAAARTTTMASKKRNRGKVSSPSPTDFYYYSGFGPKYSWGSRRRGGAGDKIKEIKKEEEDVDDTKRAQASSSPVVHVVDNHDYEDYEEVFDDFDDDDDEDDEYNGDKKRVRRPVKARSLKSIL